MYLQLEQVDYDAIAQAIAEEDDSYNGYYSYSEWDIVIRFHKIVGEHQENDYHNGTGAWVVDHVEFALLDIESVGIEVKYDQNKLIKTIEDYLWQR